MTQDTKTDTMDVDEHLDFLDETYALLLDEWPEGKVNWSNEYDFLFANMPDPVPFSTPTYVDAIPIDANVEEATKDAARERRRRRRIIRTKQRRRRRQRLRDQQQKQSQCQSPLYTLKSALAKKRKRMKNGKFAKTPIVWVPITEFY